MKSLLKQIIDVDGNSEIRTYGALRDIQTREQAISKRAALITHDEVVQIIDSVSPPSRKRQSRTTAEERERLVY